MTVSVTWNPLNTSHDVRRGWPLDRNLPAPRFKPRDGAWQLAEWRRQTGRFTPQPAPEFLIDPAEERRLRTVLASLPASRRRVPTCKHTNGRAIVTARENPPGETGTTTGGTTMAAATKKAPAKKAAGAKKSTARTAAKAPAKRPAKKTPAPAARKTAAKKAPTNGGTREPRGGRALIAEVLSEAGKPVHVKLIAERVLAKDKALKKADRHYLGKTPEQTISAALTTSHNTGGPFVKTEPGCFTLRSATARTKGRKAERPAKAARKTDAVDPVAAAHTTVISEGRAPSPAKKAGRAKAKTPDTLADALADAPEAPAETPAE